MCGIIGFLDKTKETAPLGQTLLPMLQALSCRGPDSAGVAVFGPPSPYWILQIKLPENRDVEHTANTILDAVRKQARVALHRVVGACLRLEVDGSVDPVDLEETLVRLLPEIEIDVKFTADGKFTALGGQSSGVWKIDGDKLPADKTAELVEKIQTLFAEFDCSDALEAKECIVPVENFKSQRLTEMERSQSLALENVGDKWLTMVSVSTKGVRGKS